jgi:galactokinase/mevalonate kinase-like predicted kinase
MYGGSVVSCTTVERAECRIELDESVTSIANLDEFAVIESREDLALKGDHLDIARAALDYFELDPTVDRLAVRVRTAIPMRAGLAGSTALLSAIVGALSEYCGLSQSQYHLAEMIRKIEARVMNIVCGMQDQQMTVFGGLNFMDFHGKEALEQRDDEPLATVEPLTAHVRALPFLLAHTGVEHHSGSVHSSPRRRWLEGDMRVRGAYIELAKLARRGKRALIESDWATLGALMNENHRIVSELGGSGPENDALIAAARGAGALGAKLAGAGGGGTIIALTTDPQRVWVALLDAGADCLLEPSPQPGLTVTREPSRFDGCGQRADGPASPESGTRAPRSSMGRSGRS